MKKHVNLKSCDSANQKNVHGVFHFQYNFHIVCVSFFLSYLIKVQKEKNPKKIE